MQPKCLKTDVKKINYRHMKAEKNGKVIQENAHSIANTSYQTK